MSGSHQSRKACRNEIVNGLNGSPTTFERSILRLKPSSPSSLGPLPWSEAESELLEQRKGVFSQPIKVELAGNFFRASIFTASLERRGVFLHTHGGKKATMLIVQAKHFSYQLSHQLNHLAVCSPLALRLLSRSAGSRNTDGIKVFSRLVVVGAKKEFL